MIDRTQAIDGFALDRLPAEWALTPVRGKKPYRQGWQSEPPISREEVRAAIERGENVGLRCGVVSGGVVVMDIDPRHGGRIPDSLPATVTAATGGGGWHYFFRFAGALPGGNSASRLGAGVDFRADGGQVVLPGSVHPETGAFYEWVSGCAPWEIDLAPLPDWILEALSAPPKKPQSIGRGAEERLRRARGRTSLYGESAMSAEITALENATPGTRNGQLFKSAAHLYALAAGGEIDEADIMPALMSGAQACGLLEEDGERAVLATIASGERAGKATPRSAPPRELEAAQRQGSAPVEDKTEALPLADLLATYRRWIHLPDEDPLLAALAAVVANRSVQGDPVWLLLVGVPGAGKTETIAPLSVLPDVHLVGTVTEASLLSGTPNKEKANGAKGGLLRIVGEQGILLLKDFGSILSMNREARASVLAALREIYDGAWTRYVGADGGKVLEWHGRLGLVAGCTPAIDGHHVAMASLGERFLLLRLRGDGTMASTYKALDHAGREGTMRQELGESVRRFFAGVERIEAAATVEDEERKRLVNVCALVARCRSAVERDSYRREIELIPGAESPTRLTVALQRLFGGLLAIGCTRPDAWRVTFRVAGDSMPALRRAVLNQLRQGPQETSTVANGVRYPVPTTRRALEDLSVYDVVVKQSTGAGKTDVWALHPVWSATVETLPEMSEGGIRGEGETFSEMSEDTY